MPSSRGDFAEASGFPDGRWEYEVSVPSRVLQTARISAEGFGTSTGRRRRDARMAVAGRPGGEGGLSVVVVRAGGTEATTGGGLEEGAGILLRAGGLPTLGSVVGGLGVAVICGAATTPMLSLHDGSKGFGFPISMYAALISFSTTMKL